jgi:hypothetical protein
MHSYVKYISIINSLCIDTHIKTEIIDDACEG